MFDSNWDVGQALYTVIVVVSIASITSLLVRAFLRNDHKPWPAICVGIYNIALLVLYLFGMMTQVSSEGFGFLPLFALATPWSWLLVWFFVQIEVHYSSFLGTGLEGTSLSIFIACNILAASANSTILYLLLKRREKKRDEDEAWERARRQR
jgi:hypothetical protein